MVRYEERDDILLPGELLEEDLWWDEERIAARHARRSGTKGA